MSPFYDACSRWTPLWVSAYQIGSPFVTDVSNGFAVRHRCQAHPRTLGRPVVASLTARATLHKETRKAVCGCCKDDVRDKQKGGGGSGGDNREATQSYETRRAGGG